MSNQSTTESSDPVVLQAADGHALDRDALRAIVDKLPKTADGVPLMPGDAVYYSRNPSEKEVVEFLVAPYEKWVTDVWGVKNQPRAISKGGGGWPASRCYSTRAAAESALAAEGDSDAE